MLVVAGTIPPAQVDALTLVHDQLAHPRGVVLAAPLDSPGAAPSLFRDAVVTESAAAVGPSVIDVHRQLVTGARPSSPPILPDLDPAPWRGVGPYGQGGTGMTGGVPYGRPMPSLADDRDGLKLDRLQLRIGPFVPLFPPGLAMDIGFQGDIVQDAELAPNPFVDTTRVATRDVFIKALSVPVPLRDLELARAAHHLRVIADVLRAQGLVALARRVWRMSGDVESVEARHVDALRRLLERHKTLGWATRGVGRIDESAVRGLGLGPTGRACGSPEDLRSEQNEYRAVDFHPVTESHGDARARWRVRLREATESLRMANTVGAQRPTGGDGRVEAPWGSISATHSPMHALLELLPTLLVGADWGDAVATIVSLGIDLEEAARV